MVEIVKGFIPASMSADRKLRLSDWGKERVGKTHFGATAPDPIGVIPLERNTRYVVAKVAAEYDKTVVMPDTDFIRTDAATMAKFKRMRPKDSVEASMKYYREHVDKIEEHLYRLYESSEIRSVLIDSGPQLWEDLLFAYFGRFHRVMPRDRGPANQEMKDLLNACPHHLIITSAAKEIWVGDKSTGKFGPSGWPHLGSHMNVITEHFKRKTRDEGLQFGCRVSASQANPDLVGDEESELVGPACEFAFLGKLVYPDSELGDWE